MNPVVSRNQFARSPQPRASAYRVHCLNGQGRPFSFFGIFRSDWEAIDQAIERGAAVARPQRMPPAATRR